MYVEWCKKELKVNNLICITLVTEKFEFTPKSLNHRSRRSTSWYKSTGVNNITTWRPQALKSSATSYTPNYRCIRNRRRF